MMLLLKNTVLQHKYLLYKTPTISKTRKKNYNILFYISVLSTTDCQRTKKSGHSCFSIYMFLHILNTKKHNLHLDLSKLVSDL